MGYNGRVTILLTIVGLIIQIVVQLFFTTKLIVFEVKVEMKWFFIAEFERVGKIRKMAVYHFLISFLVPEL